MVVAAPIVYWPSRVSKHLLKSQNRSNGKKSEPKKGFTQFIVGAIKGVRSACQVECLDLFR